MGYFKRVSLIHGISGVLMVIAGIMTAIEPHVTAEALVFVIGAMLILDSLMTLANYAINRRLAVMFDHTGILLGIMRFVIGIFMMTHLREMTTVFTYFFSIFILVAGIAHLEEGFLMVRLRARGWLIALILSALLIADAIFMIMNPQSALTTAGIWAGLSLMFEGIVSIYIAYHIRTMGSGLYNLARNIILELQRDMDDVETPVMPYGMPGAPAPEGDGGDDDGHDDGPEGGPDGGHHHH